jgi:hypothetical protein
MQSFVMLNLMVHIFTTVLENELIFERTMTGSSVPEAGKQAIPAQRAASTVTNVLERLHRGLCTVTNVLAKTAQGFVYVRPVLTSATAAARNQIPRTRLRTGVICFVPSHPLQEGSTL